MARALVIHRRDLANLPFDKSEAYKPPDDNNIIDVYGQVSVPVSIPIEFPQIAQLNTQLVWAGSTYNITDIDTTGSNAAFNIPNDVTDNRLIKNKNYKSIYPYLCINITCKEVKESSSTIPSIALNTLLITIPVYTQGDYSKMGGSDGVYMFKDKPSDKKVSDFNTFSGAGGGESLFYGYMSHNMIQIVPKKICIIQNTRGISKTKWSSYCPTNPSKIPQGIVCRGRNTSENQGYNQGRILYKHDGEYTESRIVRLRGVGFTPDSGEPTIPSLEPEGIPVEVEGESADGTTTNYRVVTDDSGKALSMTDNGLIVYTSIALLSLLTITMVMPSYSDSNGMAYWLPRLFMIFVSVISIIVLSQKSSSMIGIVGIVITSIILLVLGISIIASVGFKSGALAGIDNVVILVCIAIFTFVSNSTISEYMKTKDSDKVYYYCGLALSYIPKIVVIGLLFLSNPISNLLSFSTISKISHTKLNLSDGVSKIEKGGIMTDLTDTDVATFIRTNQSIKIDHEGEIIDTIGTMIDDEHARVYYKVSANTDSEEMPNTKVISGIANKTNLGFRPDTVKAPEGYDDPTIDDLMPSNMMTKFTIQNYYKAGILIGFILLAIGLIFLQPTPPKPKKEGEQQISNMVMNIIISVILLVLLFMAYNKNIVGGNFIVISLILTLLFIGNVTWNIFNSV